MQIVTIICLKKHRNQLHDAAKDLYFSDTTQGTNLGEGAKLAWEVAMFTGEIFSFVKKVNFCYNIFK